MLTDSERRQIEATLQGVAQNQWSTIDALRVIQDSRGWISDESLTDVAELLAMTPAELDSVATFFSLIFRKPVGRHVILICDSVSCWVMGYDDIREYLGKRFGISEGETSADGRFTLLPVACLGVCDRAPALMIDNNLYTDLTTEKLDEILEKYH
ncbi:MAG: NADH-quinone oxidoreductase subunit NuoE [Dissulfurispiraceae bacterium]